MQSCPGVQFLCSSQLKAIHSGSFWYLDPKVDVPNSVPILIAHMYLSGLWLGVAPRTTIKKDKCLRGIELCAPLSAQQYDNQYSTRFCVCVCVGGGAIRPMSMRIFTLVMNKIFT